MASGRQSLKDLYPRRVEVPLLILLSTVLLLVGLSVPLMTVEKSFFWQHWKNTYSVFTGIVGLWKEEDRLLAAIIFCFSILFPIGKLTSLWVLWTVRLAEARRTVVLHWLGILGKWSMLDVFVVAITVVAAKLKTLTTVTPQVGVYVFGAAIVLSMLTTAYVDHLARRGTR